MSLRGFFSRHTDSHRRRKNALTATPMSVSAESLEDRVLLSVESPILVNHGISFNNSNVLDDDIFFFASSNPRFSNNTSGSGLSVVLDGAQPFGTPGTGIIPQIQSINYSPAQGPLAFNNNANVGSSLTLRNMTLGELRIDGSQFVNNGRAGMIINLQNATVGSIIITNTAFVMNANDGLCILGTNSNVNNIQLISNSFSGNSRTTATSQSSGVLLQFQNSRLGTVTVADNFMNSNGAYGMHLDLDNTSISSLNVSGNIASDNARNGNTAGMFFDLTDSDVRGAVTNNNLSNNIFTNPTNPSITQGEGLRVITRRSIQPNGQVAEGLRNLELNTIRGNTFSNNGGTGALFDLGQNTLLRANITANTISNNARTGLNLQAKDTQNAFDVTIGGLGVDSQNNNVDGNVIDANRGAGIAIALDDTSSVIGNTTGRFQIFNNSITNTVDDNTLATEFAGEGLFVRVRGSVSLVNGASRLLNSRIDGNTITGNLSHGIAIDVSEDSEVVDLLIGDVFDPQNAQENLEGDGFFFQNQFFRNSGNLVRNNGGDGLRFLRRDAAVARDVRIIDNEFAGNANGINYTVRNDDNVINTVTMQHNDVLNNVANGILLATQIDASLIADLDNNLIAANLGDGILTLGFEGDSSDAENLGGTWTRNTIGALRDVTGQILIQGNGGRGINLNGVPGTITPLTIGLMGTDATGRSLGNLIDANGNDGMEVNAPGLVDIINNVITFNGQNNTTQDPHGDGKGIDINLNEVGGGITTTGQLQTFLGFNVIQSNIGDGLEILSRTVVGAFVRFDLLAYGNIIDLNAGRGVDILNSGDAESYIVFGDGTTGEGSNRNIVRSNGLEGFYAVNTSSINQQQNVDATAAMVADTNLGVGVERGRAPNLTLDVDGNQIQQNGLPSNGFRQLNGSGLVLRVGTTGSRFGTEFTASDIPDYEGFTDLFYFDSNGDGDIDSAFPFSEPGLNSVGTSNSALLGNGRVNARINNNTFGGNLGVDVLTESFESTQPPPATGGTWNGTTFDVTSFVSDPLARLNLTFTNNTGQSVDLVRLGAVYSNTEGTFKSRTGGRTAPDPNGPFGSNATRFRNAQRLPGRGEPYTSPEGGPGSLFRVFGGDIINVTPGTGGAPITITSLNPHGLFTGDTVLLYSSFGAFGGGFTTENLFTVTVIDANTFSLDNTENEIDVNNPTPFFFDLVLSSPFLYPGVGPSTFRIIESNNSFSGINDFTTGFEQEIFYAGGGVGHEGYTYDRELEGTFNFAKLTISDSQVAEGGDAQFTIRLDRPLTDDLEVSYFTEFAGTAVGGPDTDPTRDYTDIILDVVVIPAGLTSVTITVETNEDSTFEPSEFFKVVLDDAILLRSVPDPDTPGATLTVREVFATPVDQVGVGTILDSDTLPTVSISDAGGFEKGNGQVGTMTFMVTLSNASAAPVFVDFSTQPLTATEGVDYRARNGTLTFAPGETVKTITIEILPDSQFAGPGDAIEETLFVNLSAVQGANQQGSDLQGLGTIFEARFVTISDAFADGEGDSPATSAATFVIRLTDANGNPTSVPTGQTITVNYNTANGTATVANGDYVPVTGGVVVFNEFESQKTISVTVNQDRVYEGDEQFQVTITSPTATIQRGTGIGNILEPLEVASTRDASGQGIIRVFDYRTNAERFTMAPYPGFNGEVRVATADFNGDGILDIVTGAGPNGGPHVRVLNGADGSELFNFFAYATGFRGGIFVATGDVNGDNQDDIITGPDSGGGAHLRVFDGRTGLEIEGGVLGGLATGFLGGLRVAAANVDGLPGDEIIVGYGPGSMPRVEVFKSDGIVNNTLTPIQSFDAYGSTFTGGVFVSAADIGGGVGNAPDGFADIVTGAGAGGGPHVRVFSGANPNIILEDFFAYSLSFTGGVRVATGDVANDNLNPSRNRVPEILTAAGPGGGPHVRAFVVDANPIPQADGRLTPPQSFIDNRFPFAFNRTSGVFIAGRSREVAGVGEGSPLRLDASALIETDGVTPLTQEQLQPVVNAAFNRLQQAGVNEAALNRLRQLEFVIGDLNGDILGWQTSGRIFIDGTAAGRGYFVDLTPNQDEEFSTVLGRLVATDPAAQGKVDLLSVLLHELGHALGEDHEVAAGESHHLLAPTILPGERRLPEVDMVFAANDLFESLMDLN